jgi:hypothetical protein
MSRSPLGLYGLGVKSTHTTSCISTGSILGPYRSLLQNSANKLFNAVGSPGLIVDAQRDEAFEPLSPGIAAAAFPGLESSLGDPEQPSELSLGQTNGGPQCQTEVTERVVSLALLIRTLHARPPCVHSTRIDPK